MKKFVYLSSLAVLICLCGLGVIEYLVRQVPNPYKYKNQYIERHADNIETLILGTSHTYYGLDPSCFETSTFNLANVSQPLKYDYYLLQHYAPSCKILKRIILPVSYFSLNGVDTEDGGDWWLAINYKRYMGCPYHSDFSKYNFEVSHPKVVQKKLLSIFLGSNIGCDSLGRGSYESTNKPSGWDTSIATTEVKHHTTYDASLIGTQTHYLDDIAQYCNEHNLDLILVTTPTWHSYYEQMNATQLSRMYEQIYTIQRQFNIAYYDFLKDRRFVADDFHDADHLSDVGARKFSKILNDTIYYTNVSSM
jgi:hypothetical protein